VHEISHNQTSLSSFDPDFSFRPEFGTIW